MTPHRIHTTGYNAWVRPARRHDWARQHRDGPLDEQAALVREVPVLTALCIVLWPVVVLACRAMGWV